MGKYSHEIEHAGAAAVRFESLPPRPGRQDWGTIEHSRPTSTDAKYLTQASRHEFGGYRGRIYMLAGHGRGGSLNRS